MDGISIVFLSFLSLITIAVFTYQLSEKIKFPYTLLLVLIGVILSFLAKIEIFSFLGKFQLTPEILFYVFLPTLLFEAGYNIKIKKFIESSRHIFSLAILGLIASTVLIGVGLHYLLLLFNLDIPLIVTLLFGAIISATDPVAVVALFKEYAAPKRLALIFEGESLFNDGTAVAMFLVLLGVIQELNGILTTSSIIGGFGIFLSMLFLGLIFGSFMGMIFSKMLGWAKNENLQITLSLVVAHSTFLLADILFEDLKVYISAIVATIAASIVMGNYGRYKLTPMVEKYIDNFWEYFAFIANSFVFLLLGFLLTKINLFTKEGFIISISAILVAAISRAISVYLGLYWLKFQKREKKIPNSWKILLSWGSLRGALALAMVMMIPDDLTFSAWNLDLSIKDFVLLSVVASIYFTLFVKGLTIGRLIKKLKISKVGEYEKMEYLEGKFYLYLTLLKTLNKEYELNDIDKERYLKNKKILVKKNDRAKKEMKKYAIEHKDFFKKSLYKYVVAIEKNSLNDTYSKAEITEKAYKKLLNKLENKEDKIFEKGELGNFENIMYKTFASFFLPKRVLKVKLSFKDKLLYYNAIINISKKVLELLKEILDEGLFDTNDLNGIIEKYNEYIKIAQKKREDIIAHNDDNGVLDNYLKNKILVQELTVLNKINHNGLIADKVKKILEKDLIREVDEI